MCHAACKNFGGLMAARFFLGVGEAAIAPGFALLTGMFYKREEQPLRYVIPYPGELTLI
jgi:MFS family permease